MLNAVIIQGRLTADPEMKQTPSGVHLCNITLASERPRKKDSDPATDFIPCIAWAKTADFLSKYFHKGDMVIVSGRYQSRNYEASDGSKKTAYELSISEVNFCGGSNTKHCARPEKVSIQKDYDSIDWDEIPDIPDEF